MRALIATWIVYVTVAWTPVALAAPQPKGAPPKGAPKIAPKAPPKVDARAKYQEAVPLEANGEPEKALVVIDEGLAIAPKDLSLLELKGRITLNLGDHPGALAAYQAYLAAGATGANRRSAEDIVNRLG